MKTWEIWASTHDIIVSNRCLKASYVPIPGLILKRYINLLVPVWHSRYRLLIWDRRSTLVMRTKVVPFKIM